MHMVEAATAAAIARRCMYVAYLLSIHSATDRAEDIIFERSPRYMVTKLLRAYIKQDISKAVTKWEGPKKFLPAPKMVGFFTAGCWEKDTIFGAARKF